MTRIKIKSDPYNSLITYQKWDTVIENWKDFSYSDNEKSRLFRGKLTEAYFPFKAKDIIDILYADFCSEGDVLEIVFEGTDDEYVDLRLLCSEEPYSSYVKLSRSEQYLNNASDILPQIVEVFKNVTDIVTKTNCNKKVQEESQKFAEATTQDIPVFVMGPYSSGKSTFINALIGAEILPSNSNPVTAKVFRIMKSIRDNESIISFKLNDKSASICITGDTADFSFEEECKSLKEAVLHEFKSDPNESLHQKINKTLEILNGFDDHNDSLSDVITVEVPFGRGVLSESDRSYIIIDTPGPNSATHEEHKKLLQKAMRGFSNGIPVFVSVLDGLDTTDSLRIYKSIEKEREFDKRFALIVVNKADEGELPDSVEEENKIKNQKLPKELYAEGIFFVSSIMALGSKVDGCLTKKFYKEKYDEKKNKYSDPQDEHYKQLYQYNIMPKQLKVKAEEISDSFGDNVYANSGMFWVEKEIEAFAEKYSPYNKCAQAKAFLDRIIETTKAEIKKEKANRKKKLNNLKSGYEQKRSALLERVSSRSSEMKAEKNAAYIRKMDAVREDAKSYCSVDRLYEKQEEFRKENYKENEVWKKKKAKADAYRAISKSIVQDPLKLGKSISNANYRKKQYDKAKKESDYQTEKDLLKSEERRLKGNLTKGQRLLDKESRLFWDQAADNIRNELAKVIFESKALEESQRKDLADTIIKFKDIPIDTDVKVFKNEELFKKGIKPFRNILNSDSLDLKKIKRAYESEMKDRINSTASKIRTEHGKCFAKWLAELDELIKNNIESYSPTLTAQKAVIGKEEDNIAELELRQRKLEECSQMVSEMISLKHF